VTRIFSDYRGNHSLHDYVLKNEENVLRFEGDLLCDVRQRRTAFFHSVDSDESKISLTFPSSPRRPLVLSAIRDASEIRPCFSQGVFI